MIELMADDFDYKESFSETDFAAILRDKYK